MRREHIRLINDYREPEDNEFFFSRDPKTTFGIKDLLNYLEHNFGFRLEEIEDWKIKTTRTTENAFDQVNCGYRVVRTDES